MWFIYIVECADNSYYTGITTDLERRVKEHNFSDIKGARYTKIRRPVKLVYYEEEKGQGDAARREYQIKKLNRGSKEKLIKNYLILCTSDGDK